MNELLLLSGLGVYAMLSEIFDFRKATFWVAVVGLAAVIGLCAMDWNSTREYYNMLQTDNYSLAFTGVFSAVALVWFLMSKSYFEDDNNVSDHASLVLFALAGGAILVSFTNMAMLFLGVEILSIPLYVLVGSRKTDIASNESAFKYFLMGAFASGFLLFGIAFIYGATGSFDLEKIHAYVTAANGNVSILFIIGVLLMLVAMSFKVSAAPFHFWAPDVYQGAPTLITAFMATIVKTVAFAAFFRLFMNTFAEAHSRFADVLWAIAALTLMLGNIIAAIQDDVKRMLAYSSIGHAGFMMIGILVMNDASASAILYYTAAYSAASIAAFSVLFLVGGANEGNLGVSSFNGLVKTNPLMAGTMTLALLSMAGIPPLSGFFAKYFIFSSAMEAGYIALVIIAILASLIGVYYYFKIIIAMYFKVPDEGLTYNVTTLHKI
ncbi:MAG: hypothetical protein RLZZ292_3181, partial [Bacteroidota bacterium]